MLVFKHIDGDTSFMEYSEHSMAYWIDLLMNNALGDNVITFMKQTYGCHKDELLQNDLITPYTLTFLPYFLSNLKSSLCEK